MVSILKKFKALNNMEKVFTIKDMLPDFIHFYDKAKLSMDNINKLTSSDNGIQFKDQAGRDQDPY